MRTGKSLLRPPDGERQGRQLPGLLLPGRQVRAGQLVGVRRERRHPVVRGRPGHPDPVHLGLLRQRRGGAGQGPVAGRADQPGTCLVGVVLADGVTGSVPAAGLVQRGPGQDIAITRALATPADSDGTDIAADLVGTINWGDGSATSFATLSGGRGKRQHRRDPRAPFGNRVTTPVTVGSRPAGCSAPPTVRCCPTRNTPRPPARRR
jgi:hypothetical protein